MVEYDAQLDTSLVDELSQLLGAIDDLSLVRVRCPDGFSNLFVFPRSSEVEFTSAVEFLLGFDVRIVDPFPVAKFVTRSHGSCSLVEDFDFLIREFAV